MIPFLLFFSFTFLSSTPEKKKKKHFEQLLLGLQCSRAPLSVSISIEYVRCKVTQKLP